MTVFVPTATDKGMVTIRQGEKGLIITMDDSPEIKNSDHSSEQPDPFRPPEKVSEPIHRSKHRKQGRPKSKRLNERRGRNKAATKARKRQR